LKFFAPQGRHVAPMGVKFGMQEHPKFHPHRCNDNGIGPPKLKFLLRLDQNVEYKRPAGTYPLRDFHKICRICTPFQDELLIAKSKYMHLIKTIASIPTKFRTVIKTTKALHGWSERMHHKFKMADGRHLGKIEKSPSRPQFERLRRNLVRDAVRPS